MKRLSLILCVVLTGCGHELKHAESTLFGLDRKITLYAADGRPIREWKARTGIEINGGTIWFIADGKAVIASGTFVVEEL